MNRDDSSHDPEDVTTEEPTLADRVEASEDFGAALEQSKELLMEHRRILLLLVLGSLLLAVLAIAYPALQ